MNGDEAPAIKSMSQVWPVDSTERELGRDHHLVAHAGLVHELTQPRLALPARLHVRGVEEVAAALAVQIEHNPASLPSVR